jgi:hypothetical protein
MRLTLPLAVPLLWVSLLASCAGLTPIDPEKLAGAEDLRRGEGRLPPREELTYAASWNGFPAGDVEVLFERGSRLWTGRAVVHTVGLATALYGERLTAESAVGAADALSRSFVWSNRSKKVEVRFDPGSGEIRSGIHEEGEENKVIRLTLPGARDPFATLLALRRADLSPGRSYRTGFFTDEHPYAARALADGTEAVKVTAGEYETVVVRVDYRKIVDGVEEEDTRGMVFWLTREEPRIPVKAVIETDIGKVWLELTGYAAEEQAGS